METLEKEKTYYDMLLSGIEQDMLPERDVFEENESEASLSFCTSLMIDSVKAHCQSNDITENVFFNSVFALVLAAFTGQENAFYTTVMEKGKDNASVGDASDSDRIFPVVCPVDFKQTISSFYDRIGEQLDKGVANASLPFSAISEAYGISADVLFGFQNESDVKAPLGINTILEDGKILFDVKYRSDYYSKGFIRSFVTCLSQVAAEFIQKEYLADVELLDDESKRKLDAFNDTEVPYDKSQTIVSLFRKAADRYANKVAIVFGNKKISYAHLDELSENIAAFIAGRGLGRGDVVSVMIPRCEYMPIASLGILKSGCAYQPLDPAYPEERLNFMVRDSSAALLITTKQLRPLLTEYQKDILFIEDILSLPAPEKPLTVEVNPEDLFILLYTSGSTGVPKGVKLTHGNIVCFAQWVIRSYGLTSKSAVGAYASYGFDMHMMDTYPTLITGATEVIVGEDLRLDLAAMNDYMEKNHVTNMFMTTQVGRQFALNVENNTLRALTVAGEKLVALEPPNYPMFNGYGPTECTCLISSFEIKKKDRIVPIGTPLDNVKLYVVGANNTRLPVGAVGELWAAGPHVGSGYLNRPEKTKEVFVDNPWGEGEYGRCYRTGDIVRYLQDGNLEFIGRKDGQVKIRGFRIELSEVEAVIRDFQGIKDATVTAFDHPMGGKYVAAYIVGDEKLDTTAIADFIRARKPAYMVPAAFVQLEAIPLNQNGKVNRRMLPEPEMTVALTEEAKERKNDALDIELLKIVQEALGVEIASFDTPLTSLGMTSITSIMMSYQLSKRFGLDVSVQTLLNKATIDTIKNLLLTKWINNDHAVSAEVEKDSKPTQAPLSYSQMGVYFECMKNPAEVGYNLPYIFILDSELDEHKLADGLRTIVKAHPALDSHFEFIDGNTYQVYGSAGEAIELIYLTQDELEGYKATFVRPFDLKKGPLYRFVIARTDKNLYLLVDFHHLVFDGFSIHLFVQDLSEILEGKEPEAEKYTYYEYIADEKEFEKTPEYDENCKFIETLLGDFEKSTMIEPDINDGEEAGVLNSVSVPFEYNEVSDYCRGRSITPAAFILAASSLTVSRFVNDSSIYISTISTGRSDIRTAETYGMFVNTLPLGIEIGDDTVEGFISYCYDALTKAMEHEKYPFARIASDYGFEPDIMYEYQIGIISHELEFEPIGLVSPKFKVSICIEEKDGQSLISIHYNDALYSEDLMTSLAKAISESVKAMTAKPGAPLNSVELCSDEEMAVLESFNDAVSRPYDDADTVISMFRRAASEHAENRAVIFNREEYTYKETDAVSEKIAAYILKKGLGKGDVVSILIPRGEYMAFASLGVLKTGAAYQPLDATYPTERLNYMINDSGAGMLITTEPLRKLITRFDGEVLLLEDIPSLSSPSAPVDAVPEPEDLFILLYTSGSTGTPKGVRLTHRNLVCFINWYHRYYDLSPSDCVGQYASYGFDACMMDMYPALTKGAGLCIIPEEIRLNLNAVNDYLENHHVTHQFMTTQIARQFAVNIENHSLKHLSAGGEKLVSFTPSGSYTFHNVYGPTECTICATSYPVTKYEDNIPIGKPLDNLRLFIVDKYGHRQPVGALGELWISGPQVGDGYLNLPDKTAEAFIDNPFGEGKVYRTGDIVRYRKDGNIEYFGRSDAQVKIRGFRIELTEVEAVIREFPGVEDATVAAFDHPSGQGKFLAAYVVGSEKIDTNDIKDFISKRKPPYMVPAAIMQIERIPLNQNQKVNKRVLPKPVVERGAIETAANKAEKDFCDIFCKVLNLEEVGATEDFFTIGGTSILVTMVLVEADKLGYKMTYQDIFSNTTPRKLAGMFGDKKGEPADGSVFDEVKEYDYSRLQPVLEGNNIEAFKNGEFSELKDVLLTGATGYLGIHVLHELLENHNGRIYCLLRGKKGMSARRRLEMLLVYYFSKAYEELWDDRLFVVEGDITGEIPELPVNTVINCAALVKHFSAGTEIEDVNTGGVRNLVDYCLAWNLRLVQISTMSTVSMFVEGEIENDAKLLNITEKDLYFGQPLDLKYTRSKFLAERLILEAIGDKGLDAKIIRVGNLAARYSDGEFQINYGTNSFLGRLRIFKMLGCCTYEQMDELMEFSPIDEVAKVILLLGKTPRGCVIFHAYDHNMVLSANVFNCMSEVGLNVKAVEKEEYEAALKEAKEDPAKVKLLTSMLAYDEYSSHGFETPWHNTFTMQVLYRMGYRWPDISEEYVKQFTRGMIGLGYFD